MRELRTCGALRPPRRLGVTFCLHMGLVPWGILAMKKGLSVLIAVQLLVVG